jgi:hypothetical protein
MIGSVTNSAKTKGNTKEVDGSSYPPLAPLQMKRYYNKGASSRNRAQEMRKHKKHQKIPSTFITSSLAHKKQ